MGSIVARYLAIYLSSLGSDTRFVLIDGDEFEEKNASRMFFNDFGNKAMVICGELDGCLLQDDSALQLEAIGQFVHQGNIKDLIHSGDTILLAVDNHATRKLVSEHCATLNDTCLISGGNDGVEVDEETGKQLRGTYGNVQIYIREKGEDLSPSLTKFHAEIADPADKVPTDLSCVEALESTPQILWANLTAAAAICNSFWLFSTGELGYSELCFDIQDGLMRPASIPAPKKGS